MDTRTFLTRKMAMFLLCLFSGYSCPFYDTVGEIDNQAGGCPEPDQAPRFGAGFPAEHRRPDGRFGIRQQCRSMASPRREIHQGW